MTCLVLFRILICDTRVFLFSLQLYISIKFLLERNTSINSGGPLSLWLLSPIGLVLCVIFIILYYFITSRDVLSYSVLCHLYKIAIKTIVIYICMVSYLRSLYDFLCLCCQLFYFYLRCFKSDVLFTVIL